MVQLAENAVELRQIKKYFGSIKANDGVNLSVRAGEIHAILGENGSGKSTLMNVLSGLYMPDAGEIRIDGHQVIFHSPGEAAEAGIGMVHQHFKLADALKAWENIAAGAGSGVCLNRKKAIREILNMCKKYGLLIDPEQKVAAMTIGEKQTVEILKVLYKGARILILDEPTAVLTVQESERLFAVLREMKADGCTIILITHKLREVLAVSDRVTVLRKGIQIETLESSKTTPEQLSVLMVGRGVDGSALYTDVSAAEKEAVLKIKDLAVGERKKGLRLHVEDLEIFDHEIFGVAGIAGSGQKELCDAITGLLPFSGSIRFKGRELAGMDAGNMQRKGIRIAYVPEDRLGMGLAGSMSIIDNVGLRTYRESRGLLVDRKKMRQKTERLLEDYQVNARDPGQRVGQLSGGNIQKVLLGRELGTEADLLIAAYPARGLDIASSRFVYEKLNEEKRKGRAVLLVSEDLDDLLSICDRIAVMHGGEILDILVPKQTDKEKIGLLMMGKKKKTGENMHVQD